MRECFSERVVECTKRLSFQSDKDGNMSGDGGSKSVHNDCLQPSTRGWAEDTKLTCRLVS